MSSERPTRRSRGTGSLFTYRGAWYGQWYVGRRLIKRKLGPKRRPGGRDGLTRPQAERELRRRIEAESNVKTVGDRRTVEEAGERLIEHLGALGRKPTTLGTYSSLLRTHLARHLATRSLDRMDPDDVERMIVAMRREGAGPKTIVNALTLLHQVFEFGARRAGARRTHASRSTGLNSTTPRRFGSLAWKRSRRCFGRRPRIIRLVPPIGPCI